MQDFCTFLRSHVRREFFPEARPAAVLLVVKALALPEFLVEVDAIVPLRD